MTSTATDLLRLELQSFQDNVDSWGTVLNNVFELIEESIAGAALVLTTGGDTTLTTVDFAEDQARKAIIIVSGVLASNSNIIVPDLTKIYAVINSTTEAFTVTIKTSAGTGVVVPQGSSLLIVCDGTDCSSVGGDVTSTGVQTLTNKTLTSPVISEITNGGTITIPSGTDTLVGRATTDTLANKTLTAPVLGTPASGDLQNCTGLPIGGLTASTSAAIGVGSIELGHASDTTIARSSSGNISVEGNVVYRAGGTDVPVSDGGTGASSLTEYAVLCGGTTATGAVQSVSGVGSAGQVLTSNGASNLPTFQSPAVTSATPSADQDDYDPTGWSTNIGYTPILRLAPTASILLTGLTRGADGRRVIISNAGDPSASTSRLILIPHESVASTAANRFTFTDRMPRLLLAGESIELWYDGTSSRWREVRKGAFEAAFLNSLVLQSEVGVLIPQFGYAGGSGAVFDPGSYLSGNATQKPMGQGAGETGTTATGYAGIGSYFQTDIVPGKGQAMYIARVAVEQLSNATNRFRVFAGFSDNDTANAVTDGIYWDYQEETSVNWRMCAAGTSTRTETSSGVVVDTNYIYLGIYINGDWTSADFFYSKNGATWVFVGTLTGSNLPTASETCGWNFKIHKTAGTTEVKADIDFIGVRYDTIKGTA